MFKDDINRKINGVVKVDQDESSVLVQELNEYVITRELKKHLCSGYAVTSLHTAFLERDVTVGLDID